MVVGVISLYSRSKIDSIVPKKGDFQASHNTIPHRKSREKTRQIQPKMVCLTS